MKKHVPTTAALAATDLDLLGLDAVPELDIELEFPDFDGPELDLDAPPPARPATAPAVAAAITMPLGTGKTVRTTIRLPRDLMEEFKRRAAAEGTAYQTKRSCGHSGTGSTSTRARNQ